MRDDVVEFRFHRCEGATELWLVSNNYHLGRHEGKNNSLPLLLLAGWEYK